MLDDDVKLCYICSKGFSMITRKHHCESCGLVICDSCSDRSITLKIHLRSNNVRVCDNCYKNQTGYTIITAGEKCIVCNSQFSILKHKYNCYNCGTLVCDNCSQKKLSIYKTGKSVPQRTCDPCFTKITKLLLVDENTAKQCKKCTKSFGIFLKKYHCYNCGIIYCDDCSSKQHINPQYSKREHVRVCDDCYITLASSSISEGFTIVPTGTDQGLLNKSSSTPTLGFITGP